MSDKIKFYTPYNHCTNDVVPGQSFSKYIQDYTFNFDTEDGVPVVVKGDLIPVYENIQKAKDMVFSIADASSMDSSGRLIHKETLYKKRGVYADLRGLSEVDNPVQLSKSSMENRYNNIVNNFNSSVEEKKDNFKENEYIFKENKENIQKEVKNEEK